jgi:geranylgeranyl reductase family protein
MVEHPAKYSYDVIIIGSGAAGSAAAYFLSKNGIKNLVIEKEKLPRYKICGGGVVNRVKELLPFNFDEVIEKNCFKAEVFDTGNGLHFISNRQQPIIMMTMRQNFDSFILAKAIEEGTNLIDQCEVRNIKIMENEIEIETGYKKIISKFLIAADGGSGIASKSFRTNNNFNLLPALEYEIYTDADTYSRFCNKARFDFGIPVNGYSWVFPKSNHLSIGSVSMTKSKVNLNDTYSKYLDLLGIVNIIKSERHGYFIPIAKRRISFNNKRILFAGDSAGFADPVTAEGITAAILSGRCAAESLIQSNLDGNIAVQVYNQKISNLILKEHFYAKMISNLIYSFPKVRSFLFATYGQKLSENITDIFSGKKKYSTLFRSPEFYLKLIKYFINNQRIYHTNKPGSQCT